MPERCSKFEELVCGSGLRLKEDLEVQQGAAGLVKLLRGQVYVVIQVVDEGVLLQPGYDEDEEYLVFPHHLGHLVDLVEFGEMEDIRPTEGDFSAEEYPM